MAFYFDLLYFLVQILSFQLLQIVSSHTQTCPNMEYHSTIGITFDAVSTCHLFNKLVQIEKTATDSLSVEQGETYYRRNISILAGFFKEKEICIQCALQPNSIQNKLRW